MSKKREIGFSNLTKIKPVTDNQELVFESWKKNKNQFLFGCAGTGKTFISLYLALQDVLNNEKPQDKVVVVRSLIPTREIGFLPGDEEDKSNLYQTPYKNMVRYMFNMPDEGAFKVLYENLRNQGSIDFWSTSFLRGITLDRAIIIVDEFSNLNFHELDSIVTRVGQDSRIIFSGDYMQSDLVKQQERSGVLDFMKITQSMDAFSCTEFDISDIVRSGFIREYLITKINMGFD